jgi:2-polyprenyl-3-methyl-5-hydroxy-6-metoxy-1,4-benzoquinol methylase
MSDRIHYTCCPGCQSNQIREVLSAVDYTVSNEPFSIWECGDCWLRFTQDVPNEASIGPYYKSETYISHTDSREGLIHQLYHRVRKITLAGKSDMVKKESGKTRGRLLDMGAGTGAFVQAMSQAGWDAIGIEPDESTRKNALGIHQVQLHPISDFESLPAGSFDVITLWHVLEHVEHLHAYMERLKVLLAPDGVLFIAVPNYTSADASHYGAHWAAYDVPRHLYHFSPTSMRSLVDRHDLRIQTIKPMWFDSFYIALLSEQYKRGSSSYIRACWQGVQSNLHAMRSSEKASSLIYIIKKK